MSTKTDKTQHVIARVIETGVVRTVDPFDFLNADAPTETVDIIAIYALPAAGDTWVGMKELQRIATSSSHAEAVRDAGWTSVEWDNSQPRFENPSDYRVNTGDDGQRLYTTRAAAIADAIGVLLPEFDDEGERIEWENDSELLVNGQVNLDGGLWSVTRGSEQA